MRSLAFASIKGGVGKTTLAAHVAAALADAGRRTLLLDLDPQGHASLLAGVDPAHDAFCTADAFGLRPRARLQDVILPTARTQLFVAPATSRMASLERDLFRWGHRLQALPRAMQALAEPFDALVMDTPPQLNAFSEAALAACDLMVVPLPAMAHALQGLGEIRSAWLDVNEGRGAAVAVVNLWDRRTTATNAAVEEAFAELEMPLARSRVLRAEALNQAGLGFALVFDYAPTSEVATCLRELAEELWRRAGRRSAQ
ncbi:MAG: ParA family protein [Deltaproteobacteria bacterium]|nr:ParA family protein [Deltaproteobacteria bacterium]